ncbi:hypothetical protein [Clavibacter zhangzhiyongii]|uniref:hypothetical protein n=1 Tax=Clavibacter zhangzhiyongii TaxID=2768071 RepID=UPI0039E0F04D
MAEPTTTPAMVPSMDPAIMPPMPMPPLPPPARPPRGPSVRSSVPGARISVRVADRASDSGPVVEGRVALGRVRAQLAEEDLALLGGELLERLDVHLLDLLGRRGAEQVAVALDGDLVGAALRAGRASPADRSRRSAGCSSRPRSLSRNPMVVPLADGRIGGDRRPHQPPPP